MARIVIVAGLASSLVRFRGDMIESWLGMGHEVVAAAPGLSVENHFKEKGVSYFDIQFKRTGLNPVQDLSLIFRLFLLYNRTKPDYLFLYTVKPVIYGSIAAYFSPGCRVFSMITGLGMVFTEEVNKNSWLRKLVTCLYRVALKRNEKVFFQNPDDLGVFMELKVVKRDKTVMVNGSGVNLQYYRPFKLSAGLPVFLLIARLLKEKGIEEYVEAARIVKARYPEAIFKLIGVNYEDNPTAISNTLIELWKKESVVEIYGKTDDVRPFIAGSSVYVLPSYREGTPRTVLEAMAMGRAVITTNAPGCKETVVAGVNGFLVPVKDINALAEAMERFINEPELITKMGVASRKIAEEKYDVHKVNRAINEAMGFV